MPLNKKNKILILGFVAILFMSYQLALKNTKEAYSSYNSNLEKRESIGNIPRQLAMLDQKEKAIDAQLQLLNLEESSLQNNLLKFLNQQAELNEVKIIDFNSPHIHKTENRQIETYSFDLEGSYSGILKMVNALENHGSLGAVIHFEMEKKKDYHSKRTYLQAKIFLEQVR